MNRANICCCCCRLWFNSQFKEQSGKKKSLAKGVGGGLGRRGGGALAGR